MKVHLKIDEQYTELEVHIHAGAYTEAVAQLMERIQAPKQQFLEGTNAEGMHVLKLDDIFCIYTEDNKVFIQTDEGEFETKYKIYEFESALSEDFIRANKSTLVQLNKIASVQFRALSSTIAVLMNDAEIPISRKYLKLLKERLYLRRG